jgi:hypothetical protein
MKPGGTSLEKIVPHHRQTQAVGSPQWTALSHWRDLWTVTDADRWGLTPSAGGRLVGLLPCCGTCVHVPIGLKASRPFSLSYPLPLSLLPHLTVLRISARPPPDRRTMRLGSPLLSRAYPRSRVRRCPAPPGQISRRGYGEPDLTHQQAIVGLHGARWAQGRDHTASDHIVAPWWCYLVSGAPSFTDFPYPVVLLFTPTSAPSICSVLPQPQPPMVLLWPPVIYRYHRFPPPDLTWFWGDFYVDLLVESILAARGHWFRFSLLFNMWATQDYGVSFGLRCRSISLL